LDQGNLNLTQDLNSKEGLNIFKEQKFNKEGFDVLSEIKNQLGLGMKFESRNFECNKFPNAERFKRFSKYEIWSLAGGFKIQTDGFKPRTFYNPRQGFEIQIKI
jgi:hypothetical protein